MNLQYNATLPTAIDGQNVEAQATQKGEMFVTISALGNQVGVSSVGADGATNVANGLRVDSRNQVFNGTTWDRLVKPNATSRLLSAAASVNSTVVKASAGNVFAIYGVNANAAARYLKLYNKATAPTVGTDTPVLTLYLPPSTVNGGQFSFSFGGDFGQYFGTGIGYGLTTAAADADTGALTAGDVIALNITYA